MTFKENGYLVIPGFLDSEQLYADAVKTVETIPGSFESQTPNSPAYYGEPDSFAMLHDKLIEKLGILTECKLYKTYFYWRMYYDGAILKKHVDRPACEISGTLFLGGDEWDILINDNNGNEITVKQRPGDILLYKGCELTHWREPFKGEQHAQLFLHYVNMHGPNAWCKDDLIKEEVAK